MANNFFPFQTNYFAQFIIRIALLSHKRGNLVKEVGLESSLCYIVFNRKPNKHKEIQAMTHCNTIFHQLLQVFPRHEFDKLAEEHHEGQRFRSFNRWSQFGALFMGQLTGRNSLRDIVANMAVQGRKLYHLGFTNISRATLARTNEKQPALLYEEVFHRLLVRCKHLAPNNRFKIRNLYLLDSSTIDLCLSVFPWAMFRKTKGAIKLHTGLNTDGYLPEFINMTEGACHEITWARALKLPKGSTVVFDRGFNDYNWFDKLSNHPIFFVTRLKRNALLTPLKKRRGRRSVGVLEDREILLGNSMKKYRRVIYQSPKDGRIYSFLTNAFHLPAKTIAELYKERWQIELFFKWIKQHLKIKTFLGTSRNAVMTQIWVALCVYLLLSYLKFKSKIGWTIHQMLRVLQLTLFERRDLPDLFRKKPQNTQPPLTSLPLFKYL